MRLDYNPRTINPQQISKRSIRVLTVLIISGCALAVTISSWYYTSLEWYARVFSAVSFIVACWNMRQERKHKTKYKI